MLFALRPTTWHDAVSRRPALWVVVFFVLGIGLHPIFPHRPFALLALSVVCLIASGLTLKRSISSLLLAVAVITTGITIAQLSAFYWPASDIASYSTERPRLAQLEMRIIAPPRVLVGPPGAMRPIPPRQVTTGRVTRVKTWDGWRDATGDVLVQIEQPHPRLAIDQTIRVLGKLQRPAPASNPGQFDWATYYRRQRVLASFTVPHADNIAIISDGSPGPLDRLRARVRQLLAAGFDPMRSIDHALLRALLVGDSDPELRDIQDQFKRTGTSHHLAISGLHVAVLGAVVFFLCRLIRLYPRTTAIVTTGFVLLYGAVALPSPPVVRSVLLCAMFAIGIAGGRSVDGVQLLSLTAIAMLVWHPLDVYAPGFQLSFGTVFGLILLTPAFTRMMTGLRDRDMMLAPQRPGVLAATGRWIDGQVFAAIVTGIVAWLVSMPLVAWHFGQINPWAIAFSIVLGIPVFFALILGLMKVLLTLVWPSAAGAWAEMAAWPVESMRWLLRWMDAFPGANVPLPAPPWYLLTACYLLLLLSVFARTRPGVRWMLIFLAILSYGAILAIPVREAVLARVQTRDDLRISLLSVGAGQCAVIEPPGGRTTLVDAGSTSLTDLWRKCLGPFLHAAGRTELDSVFISHGDMDHISAVGEVVSIYGVREVLTGSPLAANAPGDPAVENLLTTLDALERPPRIVARGDVMPLGRDTRVEILWPRANETSLPDNDSGVVLKLTHGGRSVLFPADIQDLAMAELLMEPEKLKADVLIAPHHGSSERLTAAFVAAVDPVAVLSSNDRTLSHKQRRFETLIGDRALYRTNECGAITITMGRDGQLRVEPFQTGKRQAMTLPPLP